MTARMSETRRAAFLEALEACGNSTLAAERAGVSRSWVSLARRSDPGFDVRCRSAKAASAERLAASGCNRPPGAWKRHGGVDLVVQRVAKRPPQLVRSLRMCWTPRTEGRFLGELRQCNNLRLACARTGMTVSSYEAHWRRWPDFRRRVSEARTFAGLWLGSRSVAGGEATFHFAVSEEMEAQALIADRLRLARRHRRAP